MGRSRTNRSRESKVKLNARVRAQKKEMVLAAKNRPCTDCGTPFPYYVMDFDHVRGSKKFNLGFYQRYSVKSIVDEIDKCDVVCANCHRIRSYNRMVLFQTAPPTL